LAPPRPPLTLQRRGIFASEGGVSLFPSLGGASLFPSLGEVFLFPSFGGIGVVSEELKAVFRCRFFVALMYFLVGEKKHWTFSVTCRKTAFGSSETTPDPSKGGEYSPPKEASPYSPPSEGLGVVSEELKAVFGVGFLLNIL
jgi:hypothetical protein